MRSDSLIRPDRIKRWLLILFSLVALAIWMRNLKLMLPDSSFQQESHVVTEASLVATTVHKSITREMFHDSTGWSDPFEAPFLKATISRTHLPKPSDLATIPIQEDPEPPHWELTGVVQGANSPAAVLSSLDHNERTVVSKGDSVGAFHVFKITDSTVWLRKSRKTWQLTLRQIDHASAQ